MKMWAFMSNIDHREALAKIIKLSVFKVIVYPKM